MTRQWGYSLWTCAQARAIILRGEKMAKKLDSFEKNFSAMMVAAEKLQDATLALKKEDGDVYDICEGYANDIAEACSSAVEAIQSAKMKRLKRN